MKMRRLQWTDMVLVLIITIALLTMWHNINHTNEMYQSDAEKLSNMLTAEMQMAINEQFILLDSVESFVRIHSGNPNLGELFEQFVKPLYEKNTDIKNISLAPKGVQAYVYPFEGNEKVIGHDLINDERENVRADVKRTIDTAKPAVSGPYELRQGGVGLITRKAIFLDGEFWGLIVLVSDFEKTLESTSVVSDSLLFGVQLANNQGDVIWQTNETEGRHLAADYIQLPEGGIELKVLETEQSREAHSKEKRQWYVFTLIAVVLTALLIYQEKEHTKSLEERVDKRTLDLRKIAIDLEELNTQLEEEIQEKDKFELELIEAKKRAVDANEAKNIFLANMSHELRSPLQGMIGSIELLRTEQMDDKSAEYVKHLHKSSTTLLGIINQILDYSKIQNHVVEIDQKPFDLRETIFDTFNLYKLSLLSTEVEISCVVDDAIMGPYLGDSLKVKQILSNLLSNSVKFTDQGMIKISAMQNGDNTNAAIEIQIADSGCGIPEDKLSKVFDRFEQVSNNSNRRIKGTGLGLSITKELIHAMNGTISVESKVGVGTCFTIRLPFDKVDYTGHEGESNVEFSEPLNGSVLVIDDHELSLDILAEMLSKLKMEVKICSTGKCAIEEVKKKSYSLVLCDYNLPDIKAEELVKILRTNVEEETRIIGVTGFGSDRVDANSWGVDLVMQKPLELNDLRNLIRIPAVNYSHEAVITEGSSYGIEMMNRLRISTEFDDEFLYEIMTDYVQDTRQSIEEIRAFLTGGEKIKLERAIHRLKGASMNVRDEATFKTCKQLEREAVIYDRDQNEKMNQLLNDILSIMDEITQSMSARSF